MEPQEQTPQNEVAVKNEVSLSLITEDVVRAKFNRELTLQKYTGALQKLLDFKITADNIKESQDMLKEGRKTITAFKKIHEEGKAPAWKICKYWDNVLNSIKDPYEEALGKKDKELQVVTAKEAAENLRKQKEKDRIDGIKKEIDNFILIQSQVIAGATKTEQLVAVEKMIGSHKGNTSRYQEFLPDLVEKCNELTPLIKKQKEQIKTLEDLEKQRLDAEKKGDDRTLLDIEEKKELVTNSIEESKINIQETAINFATRPDTVTTPEPVMTKLTPRRRSWDFEIVDERKAFLAGMLVTELNKEKVKDKLPEVKAMLKEGEKEKIVDGIKYFYKEVF